MMVKRLQDAINQAYEKKFLGKNACWIRMGF